MAQVIKTIIAKEYKTLQGPGLDPSDPVLQMDNIISAAIGILTLIGVIFFTIQIILAGYAFISAQGDQEKIKIARKKITNGILGITIVVVAFGLAALLAQLLGLGQIFDLKSVIESISIQP